MAFRKLLSSLGIHAPSVETVLGAVSARPGDRLSAKVTLQGGGADVEIEQLKVDVVTRFEDREPTEGWNHPGILLSWQPNESSFLLRAGETRSWDVSFELPWEMPLTHARGSAVKGGKAALRTEVSIDNALDKGDFDPFQVHALPAQDAILQGFDDLGFRLDEAEVKDGTPKGAHNSTARHWQEFEYWFPRPSPVTRQLECVFVARRDSLDLILGSTGPFPFSYEQLGSQPDVTAWLEAQLRSQSFL
ncbi:sporulation protein [Streptomyces sp. NPDC005963]|uniref:sporulation protein n=1 Tax=Streptomyces sp. NPDC005963 TaxID=3156721 RepID=UPI0033E435A5